MNRAPIAAAVFLLACQNQPAPEQAKKVEAGPQEASKAGPASPHGDGKALPMSPHGAHGEMKAAPPLRPAREAVNPREVTPSGKVREEQVPGLKFKVPEEWEKKPGSSPMRLAEFTLPGPGGDAELAVYRFPGGGGDVASNVHRWRTQFTKPDGSPLTEADGSVKEQTRGSLKITVVDLAGTYVAQVTPGAPERYNDPNYRMLAAVIEGAGDPFFFKAVGPAATMAVWEPTFAGFAEKFAVETL